MPRGGAQAPLLMVLMMLMLMMMLVLVLVLTLLMMRMLMLLILMMLMLMMMMIDDEYYLLATATAADPWILAWSFERCVFTVVWSLGTSPWSSQVPKT